MVHAVYRMGLASPNVKPEAVEISEFPRLAQQFRVRAVPMTVLNGQVVVTGAMNEATMLDHLAKASEASVAAAPSQATEGEVTATPMPEEPGPPRAPGSGLILPR